MAVKKVDVPGIGAVKLYKRKGSRAIRLSVNSAGEVRVSLPYWLPYDAGTKFALSKAGWIQSQLQERAATLLEHNQPIGKSHHLYFVGNDRAERVTTRVNGSEIRVTHPGYLATSDAGLQKAAERAAIRALRNQAEQLLPQRLRALAGARGFTYKSVYVKQLTGRWGSCDTDQNIVLNLFLVQLPWHLIDYVLLHELTHTRALHHGPDFWQEFERHLPHARALRREIKQYRPTVGT
jgi:hypothetical protein